MQKGPNHKDIEQFITELSSEKVDKASVNNMYFGDDPENIVRLLNLKKYLTYFTLNKPDLILVGEAPGYNGCCISGIPFTSTHSIKETSFFKSMGICDCETIQKESTSSIVWGYFKDKESMPLFWNAYPFHPHLLESENTNRMPTPEELKVGKKYLLKLRAIYPNATVVAVGKTAQKSLQTMGIKAVEVRHPAHGGKSDFIKGLENISLKSNK